MKNDEIHSAESPRHPPISKAMRITRQNFDRYPDSTQLTIGEVSDVTQRTSRTLHADIKSGALHAVKLGGRVRVEAGELRRFLKGNVK